MPQIKTVRFQEDLKNELEQARLVECLNPVEVKTNPSWADHFWASPLPFGVPPNPHLPIIRKNPTVTFFQLIEGGLLQQDMEHVVLRRSLLTLLLLF